MGIRKIFHKTADLIYVAEGYDTLHVNKIIQKAVIKVNEEGENFSPTTSNTFLNFCSSLLPHREFSYDF